MVLNKMDVIESVMFVNQINETVAKNKYSSKIDANYLVQVKHSTGQTTIKYVEPKKRLITTKTRAPTPSPLPRSVPRLCFWWSLRR